MPQAPRMSDPVQKHICEYFDGDSEGSVYVYRSGSALARMYTERFGITDYESGPSRWMLCSDTINYMYEQGRINVFFYNDAVASKYQQGVKGNQPVGCRWKKERGD